MPFDVRRDEIALLECAARFRGRLRRAVDEPHAGPRELAEERREQRIMRAAEHDRVDLRLGERLEIFARDESRRVAIGPSLLDERHEERARARDRPCARGSIAWIARSYAPDAIVPAVPITPTTRELVARIAARAPGSTTPITGTAR